jgi:DNA-binding response OmpR family regulator
VHRRKVLLADDDPSLRQLVAMTLGTESFMLLQAGDGEESLALTRLEHPELVLLDINMPAPNGLEVCAAIRSDEQVREIKVVMLTASGNFEDHERAMALGADDYFVKPFSPVALLDRIYDLLDETIPSAPGR